MDFNNIRNISNRSKVLIIAGGFVSLLIFVAIWSAVSSPTIFNPANNELVRDQNAGLEYAIIYQFGDLANQIDADDEVNFQLIKEDLALFARKTIPKLEDPSVLIGFTFTETDVIDANTTQYTGFYYSVDDPILLEITTFDKGVIRLSITNKNTDDNIDEQLSLNGARNELIQELPYYTEQFSIVYNRQFDRISVAFDLGYTNNDIDEAIQVLKNIYQDEYDENLFSFAVNQVGFKTLEELREFANNPNNVEPPVR